MVVPLSAMGGLRFTCRFCCLKNEVRQSFSLLRLFTSLSISCSSFLSCLFWVTMNFAPCNNPSGSSFLMPSSCILSSILSTVFLDKLDTSDSRWAITVCRCFCFVYSFSMALASHTEYSGVLTWCRYACSCSLYELRSGSKGFMTEGFGPGDGATAATGWWTGL